ncbi:hypothetical protein SDC9_74526 [bioreactor metagenome]|uniref:Uncharacterized protein n=1 Tax=bioreactor metagenome TaxID=1076179 RepID=A0A644YI54_9ZZZZ
MAGLDHDHLRRAPLHQVGDLGRGQPEVDRHEHPAGPPGTEHGDQEGPRVEAEVGDPVTLPDAVRGQVVGEAADPVGELAVRPVLLLVDERQLARVVLGHPLDVHRGVDVDVVDVAAQLLDAGHRGAPLRRRWRCSWRAARSTRAGWSARPPAARRRGAVAGRPYGTRRRGRPRARAASGRRGRPTGR